MKDVSRLSQVRGIQIISATPLQTHGLTAMRVMAQANTRRGAAAIINQVELDELIPRGKRLKLPRYIRSRLDSEQ